MPLLKSRFIVLDGPDGCGKSTQLSMLASFLRSEGINIRTVRDPGDTELGKRVRKIVLHLNAPITSKSELFLYLASRTQLVNETIIPAMNSHHWVISDRFSSSTLAYQSYAGNLDWNKVKNLCRFSAHPLQPDLTIILDIPTNDAFKRIKRKHDRMEAKGKKFHEAVRKGFLKYARENTKKVKVISAAASPEQVQEKVQKLIKKRFLS